MRVAFSNGFFALSQIFYWEPALIGNIFFYLCLFLSAKGSGRYFCKYLKKKWSALRRKEGGRTYENLHLSYSLHRLRSFS